ncbi:hypothetical protein RB196_35930 [Streptomyces sp. PmtA]|uniref:hypothetical protein n=1 Tax=Streptomyces sp. PmtA TaxID=3074275 RepID=UPI003014D7B0
MTDTLHPHHTPDAPATPRTRSRLSQRFTKRRDKPADQARDVLPQYKVSAERHDGALADSPLTMARRLPRLAADAIRLAWAADPGAVRWMAALQLASAALTAVGL